MAYANRGLAVHTPSPQGAGKAVRPRKAQQTAEKPAFCERYNALGED